ncbi:cyclic nucleotide-binding domain-containing protein [Methylibium sp.]|uniref:cyclic nucleotide-binding domain-containing protein n=1 Tax=Methylibium sp. TaxID=2067992 RepID=UPI0033410ED5
MKKQLDRAGGEATTAEGGLASARTDDGEERAAETVGWDARARQARAQAFDESRASDLFVQLWQADTHVIDLSAAELGRIAAHFRYFTVPASQEVIGQDEQGNYLLVVLEGRVGVERVQPGGGRARLAEARAGDMLGEMSVLDAGSRFSACTTLTPCVVAVLDAQRLDEMMAAEPRLAMALLASLARRLSLRLRQVSARLSALLSGG